MRIGRAGPAGTAVLALALALAACGDGDGGDGGQEAPQTGELVIWSDPNRAEVLNQFKDQIEADLGITLTIEEIAEDQQATFVTASQQSAGPDVMVGAHDWIGNLVQNAAIEQVQLHEAPHAAFAQKDNDEVTFGNKIYDVPYALEISALRRK